MSIAKRMHSKMRMGGVWRGPNNIDLLGGVVVNEYGMIFLKVSPPKPEPKPEPEMTLLQRQQNFVPPPSRERRRRKPGKL